MLNFLFNNSGKLKNSFDEYPDGIAMINLYGEIIYNNKRFHSLFSINDEYKASGNINDLLPDFVAKLQENSINNINLDIVKYVLGNDSAYFEYTTNYDKRNNIYIVAFRDVTQSQTKKMELIDSYESHKKLNKNKNDFLVKITPDITSPLQSIFGFSQALIEGLAGELNEKQEKYIKIIWKNSKELSDLTDKILLLSKIEAGYFPYDYKNVDFINVLKQVRNDFTRFFQEKKLSFDIDFSMLSKRQCFADEKALKITLANFIESALTATDMGGVKITVSHPSKDLLEQKGYDSVNENSYLLFSISDTGNGFSEEEFHSLFNPYEEIEHGSKKNLSRKLGLSVAKHFIEDLNGKIWGKSAPLEGCEFNFIIPANVVDD